MSLIACSAGDQRRNLYMLVNLTDTIRLAIIKQLQTQTIHRPIDKPELRNGSDAGVKKTFVGCTTALLLLTFLFIIFDRKVRDFLHRFSLEDHDRNSFDMALDQILKNFMMVLPNLPSNKFQTIQSTLKPI